MKVGSAAATLPVQLVELIAHAAENAFEVLLDHVLHDLKILLTVRQFTL